MLVGEFRVVAPALTGHTRAFSPEPLVVGTDILHVFAGSVWLGGPSGIALTLPALAGRESNAAQTLARFSMAAAGVLVALARLPAVSIRSDDLNLGTVPVTRAGAGTCTADVVIPAAGRVEVQVGMRRSQLENPVATLTFVPAHRFAVG